MESASPEALQPEARPPVATVAAPAPGEAGPATVRQRPWLRPELVAGAGGFAVTDPYVRRFWTAALGPTAVADLLRLASAAARKRALRRPHQLGALVREGLVVQSGSRLFVTDSVPPLPTHLRRRLPPDLQREHRTYEGPPQNR